jgi:hypothetical protein
MTSIASRGHAGVTVSDFAAAVEQELAAIFGYRGITAVVPQTLWDLVDSAAAGCEARR